MGSVITYDSKCPECEQEKGYSDFYYKNHEEYFLCQNKKCGLEFKHEWKRDENGKLVTIDGSDNYQFDNLIMVETVYKNGKETIKELTQNKEDE